MTMFKRFSKHQQVDLTTTTAPMLTQLPQHVLSSIVCFATQDIDLSEGLQLRLVDRQFNHEVLHAYFEKQVFEISALTSRMPDEIAVFRCLRGFILRPDCAGPLRDFSRVLYQACVDLTASSHVHDLNGTLTRKFAGLYQSRSDQCPSELAIACVSEAVIQFFGGIRGTYNLFVSNDNDGYLSDYDNEDFSRSIWTSVTTKPSSFCWMLMVGGYFGSLELTRSAVAGLRNGDKAERCLFENLHTGLYLPSRYGHEEIVKFLLDQEELAITPSMRKRRVLRTRNVLETAIDAGQVQIVKLLLGKGWDITQSPGEYTRALRFSIEYPADHLAREQLVKLLLSITAEWRSESIVAGLLEQAVVRDDANIARIIIDMHREKTENSSQYQWAWEGSISNNGLSMAAGHNLELVRLLFENRDHLPETMSPMFDREEIVVAVEEAICHRKPAVLEYLLLRLENPDMRSLFALAAIRGNSAVLGVLQRQGVDLHARTIEYPYTWTNRFSYRLPSELDRIEWRRTSIFSNPHPFSIGSFCLAVAIKSLNVDTAEWFLERTVGIGTRMCYIARNFQGFSRDRVLLPSNTDLGPRVFLITYKTLSLLQTKQSLECGSWITSKGLMITRRPGGRRGFKIQRSKVLEDTDARLLSGINISWMIHEDEPFDQMNALLKKHKQPWIYLDD